MHTIHQSLLAVHIICGALLLFLFWVPMLAKKGSPLHVKSGQYFSWLMYFVTIPGFIMSMLVLWDPVATRGVDIATIAALDKFLAMNRAFAFFLAVLSLLGFVQLRHAKMVLRDGPERTQVRRPQHYVPVLMLLLGGILLLPLGIQLHIPLFTIFGVISILSAGQTIKFLLAKTVDRSAILREHISNMIACGIAIYTAFAAFGGRRLFELNWQWELVTWVAPGVIGTIAIMIYNRKYTAKKAKAAATVATTEQA
jgi:hypothetical protein